MEIATLRRGIAFEDGAGSASQPSGWDRGQRRMTSARPCTCCRKVSRFNLVAITGSMVPVGPGARLGGSLEVQRDSLVWRRGAGDSPKLPFTEQHFVGNISEEAASY